MEIIQRKRGLCLYDSGYRGLAMGQVLKKKCAKRNQRDRARRDQNPALLRDRF
jgi:hypothetical protein